MNDKCVFTIYYAQIITNSSTNTILNFVKILSFHLYTITASTTSIIMLVSYEIQRVIAMRSLFKHISTLKTLTTQETLLCTYIVHYATYQKRAMTRSLLTNFALLSCHKALLVYGAQTEADKTYNKVQHLRRDSQPILNAMKSYGAEYREYYYLAAFFVATINREVKPFTSFELLPPIDM